MDFRLRRPLHNYRNSFRWRCGTTHVIAKSCDSGFRHSLERRLCKGLHERGLGKGRRWVPASARRRGGQTRPCGIDWIVGVNCIGAAYSRSSGIQQVAGVHGDRRFWAFLLRMSCFWALRQTGCCLPVPEEASFGRGGGSRCRGGCVRLPRCRATDSKTVGV